jgi:DNA-directed RNA polymerase specialized sigma24 family protein
LCQKRLRGHPRRAADEEDVALSAFDSFCQRAAQGGFPQLQDRDDLWRLLVVIAARKAINLVHHDRRQRRGGGRVVRANAEQTGPDETDGAALEQIIGREPTPEFAALVAEQYERLLASLADESLRHVAQSKLEGYTNQEIAQQLGCSLRTVERKLWVIRKRWSAWEAVDR